VPVPVPVQVPVHCKTVDCYRGILHFPLKIQLVEYSSPVLVGLCSKIYD
jgi:hypothetical protein